jgi:hypothetical protein
MAAPSNLFVGQAQHETVEFRRYFYLARQPAAGRPFGCDAVEQRIFFLADGSEPDDPALIDIDMAGGAHGVAAAFGHDLVDAVAAACIALCPSPALMLLVRPSG